MTDGSVRIGLLGCGTVGSAVVRTLAEHGETIARASGHHLEVGPVLVRDLTRPRPGVDSALLTDDPARVLDDPEVGMVVEVMGGLDPTLDYLHRALTAGKPVVTANKQLLSREGPRLLAMAAEAGTELRFEASACAAIPVIKVLRESLLAAEIQAIAGILNGTTNYMLTEMARSGQSYVDALADAQELGYAEADPTEDVSGADAAAKLAILSSIAFHTRVRFEDVPYSGIDELSVEDVALAAELGFVVKLLGIARLVDEAVSASVQPTLVPARHRLAAVAGADNAVLLGSASAGEIMLVGPGAGGDETASAIVSDVLSVLGTHKGSFLHNALADAGRRLQPAEQVESAYYLRMSVADRPGVLAAVASIFGEEGLSIRTVVQKGEGDEARLVLILHRAPTSALRRAVDRAAALADVHDSPIVLRVLGTGEGG